MRIVKRSSVSFAKKKIYCEGEIITSIDKLRYLYEDVNYCPKHLTYLQTIKNIQTIISVYYTKGGSIPAHLLKCEGMSVDNINYLKDTLTYMDFLKYLLPKVDVLNKRRI